MIGRNLPAAAIKEECRNVVISGLHPDSCEPRESSLAPGTMPAANEPVGNKHPRVLTDDTPLAPICAPPHPDKPRQGDLKNKPRAPPWP